MTAVIKSDRWVAKLGAAGLALALIGGAAYAQQKAPETKAAPKAETKAPAKKKAPVKRAASPCRGLAETACGANAGCTWIKATKTKRGKDRKAYCRLKPAKKAG
jgi:hypothetical protein